MSEITAVYFIVLIPGLIVYYGIVMGGILVGEYKRRRTIVFDLIIPFYGFFRVLWKNVPSLFGEIWKDAREGWHERPW